MANNKVSKGIRASKRPLGNGENQWNISPRQTAFIDYYLSPESHTFGNAYQSAIRAGYSDARARDITAPSKPNAWLTENARLKDYTIEHINQRLVQYIEADDSRYSDKIKSLELLSKLKGLLVERKQVASIVKVELGNVNAPIDSSSTPKQ